uniref:Uncharacterized protein n=1 Tax=Mucochytrium quahogii TaxID=96639 RepID=A0A7S2RSS3_9STRA|mmetsp:Transcript_23365/g.37268  ORF Transcript_23365/g.37268 Transcript_23365/m.37268 type:complete len:2081 (+) Transcript_23365:209-6451(+)|eukprot:CAMPEP_0203758822 /NCGR_PEP_ID=MMETSP0098-20131031/11683_1 /ASSEMBLY_ACC=CAM_ASM_000208 /TAXON_ID=96639 /ORGANISM=" , Strain NY0313808BC1" /LENGTH=2080 /DNA_ID=CAMNT_0050651451 /DNA_START=227 /DNA_END=6469 /DNA_ORIENTATION=-
MSKLGSGIDNDGEKTPTEGDAHSYQLTNEQLAKLGFVWKTLIRFHGQGRFSYFSLEELEEAVCFKRISNLLEEVHMSMLRVVVGEHNKWWNEFPTSAPAMMYRKELRDELVESGSWDLVLANLILFEEGKPLKKVAAQTWVPPVVVAQQPREEEEACDVSEDWVSECLAIISAMANSEDAAIFRGPMHLNEGVIEDDYKRVIETPIDLTIIKNKLLEGNYSKIQDLTTDLQLMWDNCHAYFQPESKEVMASKNIIDAFDDMLFTVEQRISLQTAKAKELELAPKLEISVANEGGAATPPSASQSPSGSAASPSSRGSKKKKKRRAKSPKQGENGYDSSSSASSGDGDDRSVGMTYNGSGMTVDELDCLATIVNTVLRNRYDALDVNQRCEFLSWLTHRFMFSELFRVQLEKDQAEALECRAKIVVAKQKMTKRANGIEQKRQGRETELAAKLRTYQYRVQRSLKVQAKQQAKFESSTDDRDIENMKEKVAKFADLTGRTFFTKQADNSLRVGILDLLPASAVKIPRKRAIKLKVAKKRVRKSARKKDPNQKSPKQIKKKRKLAKETEDDEDDEDDEDEDYEDEDDEDDEDDGEALGTPANEGKAESNVETTVSTPTDKKAETKAQSEEEKTDESAKKEENTEISEEEKKSKGDPAEKESEEVEENEGNKMEAIEKKSEQVEGKAQDEENKIELNTGSSAKKGGSGKELNPEAYTRMFFKGIYDDGGIVTQIEFDDALSKLVPLDSELWRDEAEMADTETAEYPKYYIITREECPVDLVNQVVLTAYGWGRVQSVEKEGDEPVRFIVRLGKWGGIGHFGPSAITHVRADMGMIEARFRVELVTDMSDIVKLDPKQVGQLQKLNDQLEDIENRVRWSPSTKFGSVNVWGFERMMFLENEAEQRRAVVRSKGELLDISKSGVSGSTLRELESEKPPDDCLESTKQIATNILSNLEKNPFTAASFLNYANQEIATAENDLIPFLLTKIPGLSGAELHSKVEGVRYALLRLEGNLLPFLTQKYRTQPSKRMKWLEQVRTYGFNVSDLRDYTPIIKSLLVLETDLIRQFGICEKSRDSPVKTNSQVTTVTNESEKTAVKKVDDNNAWEKILSKASAMLDSGAVEMATLHLKPTLVKGPETEFVKLCVQAFEERYKAGFNGDAIEKLVVWASENGWSALNSLLKDKFDGNDLMALFTARSRKPRAAKKQNVSYTDKTQKTKTEQALEEVASKEDNTLWQVKEGVQVPSKFLTEFLHRWLPKRHLWRRLLLAKDITLDLIMKYVMCFEQNAQCLMAGLTFENCLKLFSNPTNISPSFFKLELGDEVVYDFGRHELCAKVELEEYKSVRANLKKWASNDGVDLPFPNLGPAGFSMNWLGEEPRVPSGGAKFSTFQLYSIQYFAGGGQPYCVLALGPVGKKTSTVQRDAEDDQTLFFNGRRRLFDKLCKTDDCRKYVIDGNFGYCEMHREVSEIPVSLRAKARRVRESVEAAAGVAPPKAFTATAVGTPAGNDEEDDLCYICQDGGKLACCDKVGCPKVYHQSCVKVRITGTQWECPLHWTTFEKFQKAKNSLFMDVLDKTCGTKNALPFLHPVEGQVGYTDVVKQPICLKDMRYKALFCLYENRESFLADAELIASNCHAWCDERYPDLPPMADRLLRTAHAALRKVRGELDRVEKQASKPTNEEQPPTTAANVAAPTIAEKTQINTENSTKRKVETAKLDMTTKPAKKKKGASVTPRSTSRRSAAVKARAAVAQNVAQDLGGSMLPVAKAETDCGTCSNCVLKLDPLTQLYDGPAIRCLKLAANDDLGVCIEIKKQPVITCNDRNDIDVWQNPVGLVCGVRDPKKKLFILVVPLSKRYPAYALTKTGWEAVCEIDDEKGRARSAYQMYATQKATVEAQQAEEEARQLAHLRTLHQQQFLAQQQQIALLKQQQQMQLQMQQQAVAVAAASAASQPHGGAHNDLYGMSAEMYSQADLAQRMYQQQQQQQQQYHGQFQSFDQYGGYNQIAAGAQQYANANLGGGYGYGQQQHPMSGRGTAGYPGYPQPHYYGNGASGMYGMYGQQQQGPTGQQQLEQSQQQQGAHDEQQFN